MQPDFDRTPSQTEAKGSASSPDDAEPRPAPHDETLAELGPLYHDFSFLGVANTQISEVYRLNQKAKAPVIIEYLQKALRLCREKQESSPSFTELFCADGYYAMVAAKLGYRPAIGIDDNRDGYSAKAKEIARRLNLSQCRFVEATITADSQHERSDVVANLGGLYHVSNPREILLNSYRLAKSHLIVQSVVSLANDDATYFESPAPGWTWGCRYNRRSFHEMVSDTCPGIIESRFNELGGNERLEDRGSAYYLIEK